MPRLSIEGALGIAAGVILFILDKMGIGGKPLYVVLFLVAAVLCVDSVVRSDWAAQNGLRRKLGGIVVATIYMVFGGWIFLRSHLRNESAPRHDEAPAAGSTSQTAGPQQHSESNPTPKLKAEIKQVADGHFIGNEDDNLMLAVGISNTGEPTTVSGWDLHVYDGNGHEHKTQGIYLPPGHNNIQAQIGTFIQSWSGDDDLAQKLATNQIGRNKSEVGILAFQVLGVPQVGKGFELRLYCQDVAGKKYEARHIIRADPPKNLHVPGLSKP